MGKYKVPKSQIQTKIQSFIDQKASRQEAAKQLGVSVATIGNYAKKFGLSFRKRGSDAPSAKVNAHDRAVICNLHDHGIKRRHIAKVVDVPLKTIINVLSFAPSDEYVDVSGHIQELANLNRV